MATYYVFSVNTETGTTEEAELSTWNGPGTRIPGSPAFTTLKAANAWIGKNPNAPICSGYFNVPEGEGGKITNTLSQFVSTLNPADYSVSTSGVVTFFGSIGHALLQGYNTTVSEIRNTADTVDNTNTIMTTIHVTGCVQVAALQDAGLTQYQTLNAASSAAAKQNAGYTGTGTSSGNSPLAGLAAIGAFFSALGQTATWERVGEGLVGVILLYAGVKSLTGIDPVKTATSVAKKVPL